MRVGDLSGLDALPPDARRAAVELKRLAAGAGLQGLGVGGAAEDDEAVSR
ncbi:MAG: hypothetical protein ACJ75K_22750 [Actinomycetes bacterium]